MRHATHDLISPVPGTDRKIHSFHFGPQDSGRKIYIQSSLHADELPGMLVAWKLKNQLRTLEEAGRLKAEIVLVPVANPIGQDQQVMDIHLGRYELESGQNFNRRFLDMTDKVIAEIESTLTDDPVQNQSLVRKAFKTTLERETANNQLTSQRLIQQRLACDAEMVLDLHCDFDAVEHLYTTPEAWEQVEPLARYLGSKASLLATDSGGQSFDECFTLLWWKLNQQFGERIPLGSFSVTIELRGQMDVSHDLAEQDAQAILNYLTHYGVIAGEAAALPELPFPATPLAAVEPIESPMGGVLVLMAKAGDVIEAGQVIAEVIDPITDRVEPIRSSTSGVMYACANRRMATAGMAVARIAGTEAYRSGYLLSP
jgi:predicted deacylase